MTPESKDFIKYALEKDYHKRASVQQLLEHDWIRKQIKEPEIGKDVQLDIHSNLRDFKVIISKALTWIL